ncbi:MAG: magnesium transporter MgtE N-terminal domain-containing protein [bacterium]
MTDLNPISLAFLERQPEAAALALQGFSPEEAIGFLEPIPWATLIPVFRHMASWPAARLLAQMNGELASNILLGLTDKDAETLLRLIPDEKRKALLLKMPSRNSRSFSQKLAFPVETVGAWMDTDTPCFDRDTSVAHCLDFIGTNKTRTGGIIVIIDHYRHLSGAVEIEKLLTSEPQQKVTELAQRKIKPLQSRSSLWEAEEHSGWTYFSTLPVIDHSGVVLGCLTHSALRKAMARYDHREEESARYSVLLNLGRAFFVALPALVQLSSGLADTPRAAATGEKSDD